MIKREKFSALRVLSLKYPLLCLGQSVNRHWSSSPRRIRASIISEWPNLQTRNQAGFSGIGFGQIAFNQMICAIHVSCRDVKWTGTLAQSKREIEIFQTLRHRYTYGKLCEENVCAEKNIFITPPHRHVLHSYVSLSISYVIMQHTWSNMQASVQASVETNRTTSKRQ